MEVNHFHEGYRLQPRINLRRDLSVRSTERPAPPPTALVHRIFGRSKEEDCEITPESNTCEKPVGSSMTLPIVLAIVYVTEDLNWKATQLAYT